MKRYGTLIPLLLTLVGLTSCATTTRYPLLVQTTQNTAWELKNYCAANEIESVRTETASQLLLAGREKLKADKEEDAYVDFDLAVLTYRLAIAEHEFNLSRERLKGAEKALREAQKELEVYQKELQRLKLPMIESNL
ncbi:MAG: hypothetical protein JRI34_04195 [Deltaproteobacteria bacterium]|nr:hypothetical protein [Deltaproteobacteria bacterium]